MILHLTQFFYFLVKFNILLHSLMISVNYGFERFLSRPRVLSFQYLYVLWHPEAKEIIISKIWTFVYCFLRWILDLSHCGFKRSLLDSSFTTRNQKFCFYFIKKSIMCAFFKLPQYQLVLEPCLALVTSETVTTTTMMTKLMTQPSLGLSSMNLMRKFNNYVIRANIFLKRINKNYAKFTKKLLPFLLKTLIIMMKSNVTTKCVALPMAVQKIKIGSQPMTITRVRMKSIQKRSSEIVVVL